MSNIYIQEPHTHGKVLLQTTVGDIDIELWSKEAPKACRNFVQLCMEGYYDTTIFHRLVKGFIVQGGDPTGTGNGGESIYGEPFKDEIHTRLRFVRRGLIAMANAGKDDNSSQFFFTLGPATELQNKHTIFGKVTGNTLYNMLKLEESLVGNNERPVYPHKIIKCQVLNNPFPDIVPRKLVKPSQDDKSDKKVSQSKATKNFQLLSFGDEAEEDEMQTEALSKDVRGKSKSSHDLARDPKLSSVPAIEIQERKAKQLLKPKEPEEKKPSVETPPKEETKQDSQKQNSPDKKEVDKKVPDEKSKKEEVVDKTKKEIKQPDKPKKEEKSKREEKNDVKSEKVKREEKNDIKSEKVKREEKKDEKKREEKKSEGGENKTKRDEDKLSAAEQVRKKLKKDDSDKKTSNNPGDIEEVENLKKEVEKLRQQLAEVKNKEKPSRPSDKSKDLKKKEKSPKKPEMSEYITEISKYKQQKKDSKRKSDREAQTMAALEKFKAKMQGARENPSKKENESEDSGWLNHTLKFDTGEGEILAKDASSKDDSWYAIDDPRNPINKRRRETKKESSSSKTESHSSKRSDKRR